jgi:hypothetical protein
MDSGSRSITRNPRDGVSRECRFFVRAVLASERVSMLKVTFHFLDIFNCAVN